MTHHVELELHVEDSSAVQHGHQVDGEHGGSVGWNRYIGAEEDVEVHGEGVQLVTQGGTDGPALAGVGGGGEVNNAVIRGPQVAVVVGRAGQRRHRQRLRQRETHRRPEGLRHVHGGAGRRLVLGQIGLGAICSGGGQTHSSVSRTFWWIFTFFSPGEKLRACNKRNY